MITTPVNAEITTYHEKFFLGMSIRQLVCLGFAILFAGGISMLWIFTLHLSTDYLGYIIMIGCSPFLAIGWIRPKELPFEKYAHIWVHWQIDKQQLPIQQNENKEIEHVQTAKKEKCRECSTAPYTSSGAKAARKTAVAAKKEIKKTERRLRTENRRAARAKKRC